ncbi:Hypothetical protein DHA2_152513 [Giardia duodenalis]|uniref:Uncharacterized protein n=1 Tax=Giardia intestinalis TaxID=5741 RepID=V6TIS5_GIAIN|nr:Hypothetical protein DHA2_152513 [Giardia intestinalis]
MPSIIDAKSFIEAPSRHGRASPLDADPWEDLPTMKVAVGAAQLVLQKCGESSMFLNMHYSTSVTSRKIAIRTSPFLNEKRVSRGALAGDQGIPSHVKPAVSVILLVSSACAKAASEIRKQIYERFYCKEAQHPITDPGDDFNVVLIITRKHLEAMFNKHTGSFVRTYYYDKLTELRRGTRLMCLMDIRLQKDPVEGKVMTTLMQAFTAPPYVLDINCKDFTFKVIAGCLGHDLWLYPWREASLNSTEISLMNSHARTEYLHIRDFITTYDARKARTAAVDSDGNCYLLESRKVLPSKFSITMLHLSGGKVENCFVGSTKEPPDVIAKRIFLVGKVLRLACPDLTVSAFTVGGISAPQVPLSQEGLGSLRTSTLELPKLDGRTHPMSSRDTKHNKRSKVKL